MGKRLGCRLTRRWFHFRGGCLWAAGVRACARQDDVLARGAFDFPELSVKVALSTCLHGWFGGYVPVLGTLGETYSCARSTAYAPGLHRTCIRVGAPCSVHTSTLVCYRIARVVTWSCRDSAAVWRVNIPSSLFGWPYFIGVIFTQEAGTFY